MAKQRVRGAQKGIHRRNLIYNIFYPYTKIFFYHYYGKVEFKGLENIPRGEPVIFAPNHQNALMDALAVLYAVPQDMVFLARADIFKARFLAFFLNSLKILPVFRQRDGATELGKNEDIFDVSVSVLKHRHYLCVMPEGNHGDRHRLRVFGKGIFRIAFAAQEEYGEKPFVKIIPVGLDYGHYVKQNTSLFINFGEPMEISDYWKQYEEGAPRAINAAKKDLIDNLKPQMIHIADEETYEAVMGLRTVFNDSMREELGIVGESLSDRFVADKEMIARLDKVIAQEDSPMKPLAEKVERYFTGLKKMNIRDWVVRDRGLCPGKTLLRRLLLMLTFPFFLLGFLTSALPYWLPVHLVRNIKDRQFHSSVKAGLGFYVTFPFWYGLTALLVGLLTGPWWIWVAYLVLVFPVGKMALKWSFLWKKTSRGSWFNRKLRRDDKTANEMVDLRREIIEDTKALIF